MPIDNKPVAQESTMQELIASYNTRLAFLAELAKIPERPQYADMATIAAIVRAGTPESNKILFPIGDEIEVELTGAATNTTLTFRIVHHDWVELRGGIVVPGMYLMAKDVLVKTDDATILSYLPMDFRKALKDIKVTTDGVPEYNWLFAPSAKNLYIHETTQRVGEGPTFDYFSENMDEEAEYGNAYDIYKMTDVSYGTYRDWALRSVTSGGGSHLYISDSGAIWTIATSSLSTLTHRCICVCVA